MHAISDGERRRVQLTMGLMQPWDLLLLDEVGGIKIGLVAGLPNNSDIGHCRPGCPSAKRSPQFLNTRYFCRTPLAICRYLGLN